MSAKKYSSTKNQKEQDVKSKIIKRQAEEIKSLEKEVENLKAMCEEKDNVISSVSYLREELQSLIDETKSKMKDYDDGVAEVKKMKKIFDEELYRGRWNLVKLLIK